MPKVSNLATIKVTKHLPGKHDQQHHAGHAAWSKPSNEDIKKFVLTYFSDKDTVINGQNSALVSALEMSDEELQVFYNQVNRLASICNQAGINCVGNVKANYKSKETGSGITVWSIASETEDKDISASVSPNGYSSIRLKGKRADDSAVDRCEQALSDNGGGTLTVEINRSNFGRTEEDRLENLYTAEEKGFHLDLYNNLSLTTNLTKSIVRFYEDELASDADLPKSQLRVVQEAVSEPTKYNDIGSMPSLYYDVALQVANATGSVQLPEEYERVMSGTGKLNPDEKRILGGILFDTRSRDLDMGIDTLLDMNIKDNLFLGTELNPGQLWIKYFGEDDNDFIALDKVVSPSVTKHLPGKHNQDDHGRQSSDEPTHSEKVEYIALFAPKDKPERETLFAAMADSEPFTDAVYKNLNTVIDYGHAILGSGSRIVATRLDYDYETEDGKTVLPPARGILPEGKPVLRSFEGVANGNNGTADIHVFTDHSVPSSLVGTFSVSVTSDNSIEVIEKALELAKAKKGLVLTARPLSDVHKLDMEVRVNKTVVNTAFEAYLGQLRDKIIPEGLRSGEIPASVAKRALDNIENKGAALRDDLYAQSAKYLGVNSTPAEDFLDWQLEDTQILPGLKFNAASVMAENGSVLFHRLVKDYRPPIVAKHLPGQHDQERHAGSWSRPLPQDLKTYLYENFPTDDEKNGKKITSVAEMMYDHARKLSDKKLKLFLDNIAIIRKAYTMFSGLPAGKLKPFYRFTNAEDKAVLDHFYINTVAEAIQVKVDVPHGLFVMLGRYNNEDIQKAEKAVKDCGGGVVSIQGDTIYQRGNGEEEQLNIVYDLADRGYKIRTYDTYNFSTSLAESLAAFADKLRTTEGFSGSEGSTIKRLVEDVDSTDSTGSRVQLDAETQILDKYGSDLSSIRNMLPLTANSSYEDETAVTDCTQTMGRPAKTWDLDEFMDLGLVDHVYTGLTYTPSLLFSYPPKSGIALDFVKAVSGLEEKHLPGHHDQQHHAGGATKVPVNISHLTSFKDDIRTLERVLDTGDPADVKEAANLILRHYTASESYHVLEQFIGEADQEQLRTLLQGVRDTINFGLVCRGNSAQSFHNKYRYDITDNGTPSGDLTRIWIPLSGHVDDPCVNMPGTQRYEYMGRYEARFDARYVGRLNLEDAVSNATNFVVRNTGYVQVTGFHAGTDSSTDADVNENQLMHATGEELNDIGKRRESTEHNKLLAYLSSNNFVVPIDDTACDSFSAVTKAGLRQAAEEAGQMLPGEVRRSLSDPFDFRLRDSYTLQMLARQGSADKLEIPVEDIADVELVDDVYTGSTIPVGALAIQSENFLRAFRRFPPVVNKHLPGIHDQQLHTGLRDKQLFDYQNSEIEQLPKRISNRAVGQRLENAGDIFRETDLNADSFDAGFSRSYVLEKLRGIQREMQFPYELKAKLNPRDQAIADKVVTLYSRLNVRDLSPMQANARDLAVAVARQNLPAIEYMLNLIGTEYKHLPGQHDQKHHAGLPIFTTSRDDIYGLQKIVDEGSKDEVDARIEHTISLIDQDVLDTKAYIATCSDDQKRDFLQHVADVTKLSVLAQGQDVEKPVGLFDHMSFDYTHAYHGDEKIPLTLTEVTMVGRRSNEVKSATVFPEGTNGNRQFGKYHAVLEYNNPGDYESRRSLQDLLNLVRQESGTISVSKGAHWESTDGESGQESLGYVMAKEGFNVYVQQAAGAMAESAKKRIGQILEDLGQTVPAAVTRRFKTDKIDDLYMSFQYQLTKQYGPLPRVIPLSDLPDVVLTDNIYTGSTLQAGLETLFDKDNHLSVQYKVLNVKKHLPGKHDQQHHAPHGKENVDFTAQKILDRAELGNKYSHHLIWTKQPTYAQLQAAKQVSNMFMNMTDEEFEAAKAASAKLDAYAKTDIYKNDPDYVEFPTFGVYSEDGETPEALYMQSSHFDQASVRLRPTTDSTFGKLHVILRDPKQRENLEAFLKTQGGGSVDLGCSLLSLGDNEEERLATMVDLSSSGYKMQIAPGRLFTSMLGTSLYKVKNDLEGDILGRRIADRIVTDEEDGESYAPGYMAYVADSSVQLLDQLGYDTSKLNHASKTSLRDRHTDIEKEKAGMDEIEYFKDFLYIDPDKFLDLHVVDHVFTGLDIPVGLNYINGLDGRVDFRKTIDGLEEKHLPGQHDQQHHASPKKLIPHWQRPSETELVSLLKTRFYLSPKHDVSTEDYALDNKYNVDVETAVFAMSDSELKAFLDASNTLKSYAAVDSTRMPERQEVTFDSTPGWFTWGTMPTRGKTIKGITRLGIPSVHISLVKGSPNYGKPEVRVGQMGTNLRREKLPMIERLTSKLGGGTLVDKLDLRPDTDADTRLEELMGRGAEGFMIKMNLATDFEKFLHSALLFYKQAAKDDDLVARLLKGKSLETYDFEEHHRTGNLRRTEEYETFLYDSTAQIMGELGIDHSISALHELGERYPSSINVQGLNHQVLMRQKNADMEVYLTVDQFLDDLPITDHVYTGTTMSLGSVVATNPDVTGTNINLVKTIPGVVHKHLPGQHDQKHHSNPLSTGIIETNLFDALKLTFELARDGKLNNVTKNIDAILSKCTEKQREQFLQTFQRTKDLCHSLNLLPDRYTMLLSADGKSINTIFTTCSEGTRVYHVALGVPGTDAPSKIIMGVRSPEGKIKKDKIVKRMVSILEQNGGRFMVNGLDVETASMRGTLQELAEDGFGVNMMPEPRKAADCTIKLLKEISQDPDNVGVARKIKDFLSRDDALSRLENSYSRQVAEKMGITDPSQPNPTRTHMGTYGRVILDMPVDDYMDFELEEDQVTGMKLPALDIIMKGGEGQLSLSKIYPEPGSKIYADLSYDLPPLKPAPKTRMSFNVTIEDKK